MWRASGNMALCGRAGWRSAGFPIREPELLAFQRHRFEIEYAVMRNGGLEAIRMADEPVHRVTAITSTGYAGSLRIDVWKLNNSIEDGIHVCHDLAAPV